MGERPAPRPGVDPLFTDDDAIEILDFLADEKLTCTGCGFLKVDTFDPANEWAYEGVALACHACAARRRREKQLDSNDGVYIVARARDGTARTTTPASRSTAPNPPTANDSDRSGSSSRSDVPST